MTLSACSAWRDSRVNPSNWFGRDRGSVANVQADGTVNPLLPQEDSIGMFDRPDAVDISVPITTVTELRVEPTNTGAIIYASGVANRQGAYSARLRRERSEEDAQNGILTYSFRVGYPVDPTPQGPEQTRRVHEAASVSNDTLQGIRLIRVVGETNAREARRR